MISAILECRGWGVGMRSMEWDVIIGILGFKRVVPVRFHFHMVVSAWFDLNGFGGQFDFLLYSAALNYKFQDG